MKRVTLRNHSTCTRALVVKSILPHSQGNTAAEANTYLQTIIRWAHRTREPMQIVFLNAKSAFDLSSTEATTEMMRHLGTPEDLIDKINNLTTKGTFRVKMSKKSSAETEILSVTMLHILLVMILAPIL